MPLALALAGFLRATVPMTQYLMTIGREKVPVQVLPDNIAWILRTVSRVRHP